MNRNNKYGWKLGFLLMAAILIMLTTDRSIQVADAESTAPKKFQLYATDGYLMLPDGTEVYIWGYSLKNEQGTAEYPSPTLEVNEEDNVEITLTNIGTKKKGIKRLAHTIHWHGLDTDQQNDGVPHTSPAIQVGDSYTYRFTAGHAGTYFYHCHVDTIEHLQMGMHGAFIVKAKNGVNQAWTGGPAYDKEYTFVVNEIDPVWHKAVEEGRAYDRTTFHPTYWTINGKAYPDTEKDASTMIQGTVDETVLIRMINSGYEPHSFHMHGYHFQVIASDGRPLPAALTKDTVLIGPGERYDLLVTFDKDGMFPFHSHSIVDNTNNGVYPGGLHTMIDITKASGTDLTKSIRLKVGRKEAKVNGSIVKLSTAPVLIKGITYVPIRFISEQLLANVKWNQKEQSVVYKSGQKHVQLWLNSTQAKVDGYVVNIDAPPKQINGSTMVSVRFVSDLLGGKIANDKATGELIVTAVVQAEQPQAGIGTDGHAGHEGNTATGTDSGGSVIAPTAGGVVSTTDGTVSLDPVTVDITSSAFAPGKLTIKKGQTVKWVNKDSQIHTVIDLGDVFISKNLLQNETFTFTFDQVGTYTYYCSTHPSMQGEIIVTD
jgi:plastocyanin